MNDNTKLIAALLAGVAAGAALGILFTPETGSDTRDKLNDALKNLGDSIKDRAAEEIDNLSNFKEGLADKIKSTVNKVEDLASSAKRQAPVTES